MLVDAECLYGREHLLVARLVESLRTEDFADDGEGVLVDHERAKNQPLRLQRLRWQVPQPRVDGHRSILSAGIIGILDIRHDYLEF